MKLINFVFFQLGWLLLVWGAAQQKLLLPMIAVVIIFMIHIIQARFKKDAVILLLIIMLLGPIFDQCLLSLGFIKYKSQDRKSTRLNSSHMSESRMPSSA